jgi:RNA ligase
VLLSELLDIDKLKLDVRKRYISVRAHPKDPYLRIFNYTHQAAFDAYWTHETKTCRGLIVRVGIVDIDLLVRSKHEQQTVIDGTDDGIVVARPFKKFFNAGEHVLNHEPIPLYEPFTVTTKADGSLGIWYEAPDGPAIATRGSFESDQAIWATNWLRASEPNWKPLAGTTALFEIVYPENRIVVDYGGIETLFYIGSIDNESGREFQDHWSGNRVTRVGGFDKIEDILSYIENAPQESRNSEGFVVTFESGLKVKYKLQEYMRLHRILTGLNERAIWRWLSEGGTVEEFIDGVPDEFYDWVRQVEVQLRTHHEILMESCKALSLGLRSMKFETRKELAEFVKTLPPEDQGWAFRAYDEQWDRLSKEIWRAIQPAGGKTFREDDDS